METPDSCREVAERYCEEQKKLAKRLLELVSDREPGIGALLHKRIPW
jgi:hypothetical protein